MNTQQLRMRVGLGLLPLALALATVGCYDQPSSDAEHDVNTSEVDRAGTNGIDTAAVRGTTAYGTTAETTAPKGTPEEERMWATTNLNGMRAALMGELGEVRNRLNNGEQPEAQRTADQSRAAVLAQGLERIDRCLTAIDESTDATWADIRDKELKEVDDVRVWMRDNHYGEATASVE
jgi:hypothetical protein